MVCVTILTFCSFLSCISATFIPAQRSCLALTCLPNRCFVFSCPALFRPSWSERLEQNCCFPSGSDGEFFWEKALGWTGKESEAQWTILGRLIPSLLSACDERLVAWSRLDLETSDSTKAVPDSEGDSFTSFFFTWVSAFVRVCWCVRGFGVSSWLWDILQKDCFVPLWGWLWFRLRGPRWPEE